MPSPSLPNTDPIELHPVDITPYRRGNTGIDYVTTLETGAPGPHVMVSALVHGNELCGPIALDWLFRQTRRPLRGTLTLAFLNVAAYDIYTPDDPHASRFVDEDFNRIWDPLILDDPNRDSTELRRAREVRPLLDSVDILLDLHSMQRSSPALILSGPLEKGRVLARQVGAPPLVVTDTGHAAGRRMRDYDGFSDPASDRNALLVECGQHWSADAARVALDTTVRFLRATGVVAPDFGEDVTMPSRPQVFAEVSEPITIESEDGFTFANPWMGSEIIAEAGTLIGHDGDRPVVTPYDDCMLIMPTRRTYKGQTAVRLARVLEKH